jgi:hypothetical protein
MNEVEYSMTWLIFEVIDILNTIKQWDERANSRSSSPTWNWIFCFVFVWVCFVRYCESCDVLTPLQLNACWLYNNVLLLLNILLSSLVNCLFHCASKFEFALTFCHELMWKFNEQIQMKDSLKSDLNRQIWNAISIASSSGTTYIQINENWIEKWVFQYLCSQLFKYILFQL